MDQFQTNKYQARHENILFVSKKLYEILDKHPLNTQKLIEKYVASTQLSLTEELDNTIMLSLCFLRNINLIEVKDKKLWRKKI